MNITVKKLLQRNDWDTTSQYILSIFPYEINNLQKYEKMFYHLLHSSELSEEENEDMFIYLERLGDHFSDYDLSAREKDCNRVYSVSSISWEDILNYSVNVETLAQHEEQLIIACLLFELSWTGFTKQQNHSAIMQLQRDLAGIVKKTTRSH